MTFLFTDTPASNHPEHFSQTPEISANLFLNFTYRRFKPAVKFQI